MKVTPQQGKQPLHAPEFVRERKFFMMIPLLILPFLTMAFWALGGGRNSNNPADSRTSAKGLITTLPQAQLKSGSEKDKMGIYQTVSKDSSNATTGVGKAFISAMGFKDPQTAEAQTENNLASADGQMAVDPNEAKIQAKLAQINAQLNQSPAPTTAATYHPQSGTGSEVKRLQMMMAAMKSSGGEDPEMKQLSRMLQQISEIQNPAKTENIARSRSATNSSRVYAVTAASDESDEDQGKSLPVHFTGNRSNEVEDAKGNIIQAVIHEDQTLVSGAVVKLRLVDGIYVKAKMIPKGTFIYGTCALNNERLEIKISSIRYLNNILPVALTVYDLDGLEGLYVPGSISRDAAKTGMSNAVNSVQLMSLDQSIGAQAAGAGIEAAKGLFGKKVKQIKVKVKSGYEVLLRDNNERNN
jgi:conjugative transposon TraM protein